jgi:RNA polymerase sigma-70 factor (ECF subfamily)
VYSERNDGVRGRQLDARSDAELIALAQRGEVPAYEALVLRYQTLAFRTAYVIAGDAAEAEDATQTAFVKAWQALDRFEPDRRRGGLPRSPGDDAFRPWLLTIVANEARNRVRSRARRPTIEIDEALHHVGTAETDSPEALIEASERREELVAALNRRSEGDRTIIVMRYVLELSEPEMAAALGIPRGTVKSRLSRALARTRERLNESGQSQPGQEDTCG